MEIKTISGSLRSETGKRASRRIRHQGLIPANLYGSGKNVSLLLNEREFRKVVPHSRTHVILDLRVEGGEGDRKVLVKGVQHPPISQSIVHVDFQEISMDKPIKMPVNLTVKGEATGVKMKGGVLHLHLRKINIECLPKDLVTEIELDVTELDLGQSWHVREIPVSDKIRILEDPDRVVVAVTHPKVVAEAEKPAAEGEAEAKPEEKKPE